jgi:hypothetical protein
MFKGDEVAGGHAQKPNASRFLTDSKLNIASQMDKVRMQEEEQM